MFSSLNNALSTGCNTHCGMDGWFAKEMAISYFKALSQYMSSEREEVGNNRVYDDPPTTGLRAVLYAEPVE
jgi:hypothetical protein